MEIAKILDLTAKTTVVKKENCEKSTYALDEIKEMNDHLDKVRCNLEESVRVCQAEEVKLKDFTKELEQLHRERLVHVEQLRHIHADISTLEAGMKRAEEEKSREVETAQYLYQGYVNLLKRINVCRASLGLEALPQPTSALLNSELFTRRCDSQLVTDYCRPSDTPILAASFAKTASSLTMTSAATAHMFSSPLLMSASSMSNGHSASFCHSHSMMPMSPLGPFSAAAAAAAAASANFLRYTTTPSTTNLFGMPPSFLNQPIQMRSSPVPSTDLLGDGAPFPTSTCNPISRNILHSPSSFRQQPPPMKACLSCHQQIHRNAPICPLCKAKSRSKNPKKLKKKSSDSIHCQ